MAKGFVEKNQALIIIGVLVLGTIYLFQEGYLAKSPTGDIIVNVGGDTYAPPIGEIDADPPIAPIQPAEPETDLRDVYLGNDWVVLGLQKCIDGGGQWVWQADAVGCIDYVPATINCTGDALVVVARDMCTMNGGYWYCHHTYVACSLIQWS